MVTVGFVVDAEPVINALKQTAKSVPSITKQMMTVIGKGSAKATNDMLKATTRGRKGFIGHRWPYDVTRAYTYKATSGGVSVYPKKVDKTRANDLTVPVMATLNYGAEIKAVKAKYLGISGDGYHARVKAVRVPGKYFVEAGKRYRDSDKYERDLDKIIEKELKKFWG